ncbi:transcriptional regulator [Burkholderia sp. SFA1]|uniref:XRE family transcriptional regulator n=1 Tax=Caballeronia cordobensis TaxID=1353886 RepID=A0A158H822_CABCO|nr:MULTISPECIES: helix-turn-helix domain-containing protein [Caballeronia]MCE4544079.1 helix-turn-helix domain-containing protein [Caballeronia sp. PC1]MCE4571230.1 helix-turn-helix domain-containing protein [Caballeronia sp. CLC5]BBP98854.1 transcriptional regulator [Burkholderia sp. SFA1]SAL40465.1 XRE family transcriptional regulator [Caballeronia cordobensis]
MQQVIATIGHMGHVLAAGRKRAGLTQAQAAAHLGISQSRISTLERDSGSLTLDQLLAMFGVYGLQLLVRDRPEPLVLEANEPSGADW